MKAAVFEGNGKLEVKEVPQPALDKDLTFPKKYNPEARIVLPKEKLVLLKVLIAGICGTDLQILKVPPGHSATVGVILGHEYVGEVIEVGKEVENVSIGDRVAVDPNIKCGTCRFCKSGFPNLCENVTTLGIYGNGGFAEYNVAPASQLFPIPPEMDLETAVLFEPLSCTVHNWERLSPQPADSILIFGAGPQGCLHLLLSQLAGAQKVIVVEPSRYRKKIAKELGAIVVDPREDVIEIVKKHTKDGVDISIDASGIPEVINTAIKCTRPGGKISTFGQQNIDAFADKVSFTMVTQKELTILGSYIATWNLKKVIEILKRKEINWRRLVSHTVDLENIKEGFELLRKGESIKVAVYP